MTSGVENMQVTPWWKALKLRGEIVSGGGQIDDVQMSLQQAVYGVGSTRPPYADAGYYGEITHPTAVLVDLLSALAIRLGAGPDYLKAGRALWRPDQGMGGGKSHAVIGAFHMGTNPAVFSSTEIGKAVHDRARQILGHALPDDLGSPRVIVLPCDSMTPGAPDKDTDGPARTFWERFLWRLVGPDYTVYERYAPFFNNKAKIGEALRSVGHPVLILIDEIMNYLGNASDADAILAGKDLEFLRALTDVINDVPHCAALIVMISSEKDPMAQSAEARDRRNDLNALLERNGSRAPVTENTDFAAILRRRLFDAAPAAEVINATASAWRPIMADTAWVKQVWSTLAQTWTERFTDEVARCYPFHPQLIHLAEDEWAEVSGFQRVRSTIRIFAATVYALQQRAQQGDWAPTLIGPGDLPLSDPTVRESLLDSGLVADERTVSNYRSLGENEIVTLDEGRGAARLLDLTRPELPWRSANPRASERAGTFIFVSSMVGARPGGRRGAAAPEIKAATAVPSTAFALAEADGVISDLTDETTGMSALEIIAGQGHNKPTRYFLSTRLTYRMLVTNLRKAVTDAERDACIATLAQSIANTGPFRKKLFIEADPSRTPTDVLVNAGTDDARTTRLVILDPAQFVLRNGAEDTTMAAIEAAMGLGTGADRPPVPWASSAVYVVANAQRRAQARNLATEYLARSRALATQEVQADSGDLKATGERETKEAKDKLTKALKRAFQHVVFLSQPVDTRIVSQHAFDDDTNTALDGTQVWKALADKQKTFDTGQFNADVLVFNLRDIDYGRPLAEVRDAFWNAPRLALPYGGEEDIRQALYHAVRSRKVRIVDGAGTDVVVTSPDQINLSSTGLRLARPRTAEPGDSAGPISSTTVDPGSPSGAEHDPTDATSSDTGSEQPDKVADRHLKFSLTGAINDDPQRSDALAELFRVLYTTVDANKASYAQGTIELIVAPEAAEKIADAVRALGVPLTNREYM